MNTKKDKNNMSLFSHTVSLFCYEMNKLINHNLKLRLCKFQHNNLITIKLFRLAQTSTMKNTKWYILRIPKKEKENIVLFFIINSRTFCIFVFFL